VSIFERQIEIFFFVACFSLYGLYLLFFMDVELRLASYGQNIDGECLRMGRWGEFLYTRGRRWKEDEQCV